VDVGNHHQRTADLVELQRRGVGRCRRLEPRNRALKQQLVADHVDCQEAQRRQGTSFRMVQWVRNDEDEIHGSTSVLLPWAGKTGLWR
jgi:hypothetical protein